MGEGHTVDIAYLDFAKAKLFFNIDGNVLNWIKSYLSRRPYQVHIGSILSDEASCLSGVPQGFDICPLPFHVSITYHPAP